MLWHPEVNPLVLAVEAVPGEVTDPGTFDLRDVFALTTVLRAEGVEHVLFSDGTRTLQVVVTSGTLLDGPVSLRIPLRGFLHLGAKIDALARLHALGRTGRLPPSLYPAARRARRWIEMVRAWDGEMAGASRREIAEVVFGEGVIRDRWEDGYRARTQRLIRAARSMVQGGYLSLLGHEPEGGGKGRSPPK